MALKAITLGINKTRQEDADELNDALNDGFKVVSAVVIEYGNSISYILHKQDPVDEVRERKAKAMGAFAHVVHDDGSVQYLTGIREIP
jgi:hypothetical protein